MDSIEYNKALEFATIKHLNQYRTGGEPYITHPIAVSKIVMDMGYTEIDYLITALFHDLLEDTDTTEEEIIYYGNENILTAVKLLTKYPRYNMDDYISKIKLNDIAKVVKTADRLHNLKCAVVCDEKFKIKYINETKKYYLDFSEEIKIAVEKLEKTLK